MRKQDNRIRAEEKKNTIKVGESWKPKSRNVFELLVGWVPGHNDIQENEDVDKEAKEAAQGKTSIRTKLPSYLRRSLPISIAAAKAEYRKTTQRRWKWLWKKSHRYHRTYMIDQSLPSKLFMKLTESLT
ncbi:hypothetical protein C8Q75DRAFT_724030 [Abortiporus biennis]|nr:hypothetical protein C8Q75DRAFT_724030 [Abortiporus biennis]